jgi:glucose-6-phosphate dehydrogenase assembly protein OpcA
MPTATEKYSLGLPVEVDKIDNELKKLWAESIGTMTRASLINLAVYSETPGSLEKNTQLLSRITENHSCRAIVIGANRDAKENRVEAWVSAHCHVSQAGGKQLCSEQLSFLLEGPCASLLPSIVFSHLDSDLPLHLWWQGEFHDPMDPQLWAWVDRLVFDSHDWKDFDSQMHLVETAQEEAKQRVVLCDLNWTRLDKLRLAIAQFFDHPASHHHFGSIENAQIDFAAGFRSAAVLLAGWLGAQLNWKVEPGKSANKFAFADPAGRKIDIVLCESAGEPISRVLVNSGGVQFVVSHTQGADLLEVWRGKPDEKCAHQMMPAGTNDPVVLVSDELMRGGPHRVYLRAVNCVRSLL